MHTRRTFNKFAAATALAAPFGSLAVSAAKINSRIHGVMIGAQTYSFRDMPLDKCLEAMKDIGLGYAELYQGHIEPKGREALAAWRKNPPIEELKGVSKTFDDPSV